MSIVLLTGGGGYIGSILSEMLLDCGYSVRVLDRFFFGENMLDPLRNRKGLQLIRGDVRSISPAIFENVDYIIDLAAISNDPAGELDPAKTIDINYLGRSRMAHLGKMAGIKRYILASSCSVYGCQDDWLEETSEVNPLTTYAQANYLAEKAVLNLAADDFIVTVLRQATVYGLSHRMRFDLAVNGMTHSMFSQQMIVITGDGDQWRPFVHITDTCRAFIMALEADPQVVNGQIFNVGSNGQNVTIAELARLIAGLSDEPVDIRSYGENDIRSYRVSFDKITARLGYQARVGLAEGAREVLDSLQAGRVFDNERCLTVHWYAKLLGWKKELDSLMLNGELL